MDRSGLFAARALLAAIARQLDALAIRFWEVPPYRQGRIQPLLSIEFIALPSNPALNRTGRHATPTWRGSARPAG